MSTFVRIGLVSANVVLLGLLAAYWLDEKGQLKHTGWTPPAAMAPEFPELPPAQASRDASNFLAALDRPLFSPSRRPPPPAPVVSAAVPEVDHLSGVQLVGVYGGGQRGGIIAMLEGKMQRKSVGQHIGPWELRSVAGREATLVRGEESRTLRITRTITPPPDRPAGAAAAPPPPAGVSMAPDTNAEDARRDRIRRLNVLRAKGGMPPLQE